MKKQNAGQSERSKVRIFFVDADLAPGDMHQLTDALTSAIRPTHIITKVAAPQRLAAPMNGTESNGAHDDGQGDLADVETVEEATDEVPAPKGPVKKRSYRKPVPVEMDMNGDGKSFEVYALEKGPADHRARYLVAAAWLHDHANTPTITVDHVFTCYKSADWTFDVSDPAWPFRKLKADGLGSTKAGAFSIGHLGLAEVKKMKPGS